MPPTPDPFEVVDLSEHALVPTSAAQARAVAATLASSLSARARHLEDGVARLADAERRADAHLRELQDASVAVALAGGVPVELTAQADEVHADDALHPAVIEAEEILREQRRRFGRSRQAVDRLSRWESWPVFILAAAAFSVLGYLATAVGGMIPVDAISRVGSAQAVLIGRDPHLEAIGFIWGPFPTFFELPFVLLRHLWHPFTESAMAAIVVSALFMAGALTQLLAWGRESGAGRWFRLSAVVLLAVHPLIWTHGANGMSEACWIFFLMLAMRHLAKWIETDDTRSLVMTSIAVSLAYLTRYETAAVFAAILPLVAMTSWHRSAGAPGEERATLQRQRETILDVAILSFPVVVTMCAWAGASWAIIGEPFPQFTSEYGNSALVRRAAADTILLIGDPSSAGRAWFFLRQVIVAAPLLAVLVVVALRGSHRTVMRTTSALAVLGAPLALQLLFAARGSTFPWLRYVVVGVVLCAALAMVIAGSSTGRTRWYVRLAVLAALVPGIVWTTSVVSRDELAPFDQADAMESLAAGVRGESVDPTTSPLRIGQQVARDIDRLPDVEAGTVLMDQASNYVWGASERPNLYVVPQDRDFEPAVADPETFGIRYLLLIGGSNADAVSAQFPTLWDGGQPGFATLVAEWGDEDLSTAHYRLFKLEDPDPRNRAKPDPEFGR
jgi:hypothetical protein